MKIALLLSTAGFAWTQTPSPQPKPATASAEPQEAHKGVDAFEVEFVASDIFRSGSYIQPLWRHLAFDGHYFGGLTADVGFTGASWIFHLGELKLAPGFGVVFGSKRFTTSPAPSLRWEYERGWFVTQGLVLQGIRETPIFEEEEESERHGEPAVPDAYVRPRITDGNHFSARWKRVTVGGTFEHIAFREGSEWKGGGRIAVRLFPRVSAILYVLAPGRTEWRGGILIQPRAQ